MEKIVVVVTVFNEEATIRLLVDVLLHQTLKPSEIVIVDGGSTDSTWSILQSIKEIKSYKHPGNRSMGRNFGVNHSKSSIIAFTDAGCVPHKNWLAELAKPFKDKDTQVVSGYYEGRANSVFQKCLIPFVLVMPDAISSEFFPATRSMAMSRAVWNQSGGFDERLSHNEDYAFAHTLKKQGVNFTFAPDAVVIWEPRKNLKQAAWMFMRFAIGDAQAGILRPKVKLLAIRYYVFSFLVFISPWFALLAVPYIIWAIAKNYKYVQHIGGLFWLPTLQITADIMVLFGTIVGMLSRIK